MTSIRILLSPGMAAILLASLTMAAPGASIFLNGDSPGQGSNLENEDLVVAYGTISLPKGEVTDDWDKLNAGFIAAGFAGNVFRGSSSAPAKMELSFDVFSVSFAYGVNSTYFIMDLLDEHGAPIQQFESTSQSGTHSITLTGPGPRIRGIQWKAQYGSGMIDNMTLQTQTLAIPEPAAGVLAGTGLATLLGGFLWRRRRKRS